MKKLYSLPSGACNATMNAGITEENAVPVTNHAASTGKFCGRAKMVAIVALLLFTVSFARAATITIMVNTNWSTISPVPTSADDIIIINQAILTVNVGNGVCKSITLGGAGPNNNGNLTFNANSQVTVSETVAFADHGNRTNTLTMNLGGKLICQVFTVAGTGHTFTSGAGTVELTASNILPPPLLRLLII